MRMADNLATFMYRLCRNSGSLKLRETSQPLQACNGTALLAFLFIYLFIYSNSYSLVTFAYCVNIYLIQRNMADKAQPNTWFYFSKLISEIKSTLFPFFRICIPVPNVKTF
jgi:hypothetical protein